MKGMLEIDEILSDNDHFAYLPPSVELKWLSTIRHQIGAENNYVGPINVFIVFAEVDGEDKTK